MANTTWSATDKTSGVTLSGTNNVVLTTTGAGAQSGRTIDRNITGKFYWEYTFTTIPGVAFCGIANQAATLNTYNGTQANSANLAIFNCNGGNLYINGSIGPTLGTFTAGQTACIALDLGAQLIWVRNGAAGNWNANAAYNPATGVGGASVASFLGRGIPAYGIAGSVSNASVITANFGDSTFVGAVPSGFTSGFTSGASPPLNVIETQIAIEQWSSTGALQVQMTQAAIEQWAVVASGNTRAVLTQIALEEWASTGLGGAVPQARAMVLA